ncbi:hypothetical protein K440DRAFT_658225 [Wilcoxina mikolae CBS 423.85]|nr:hypothetical protein K440DRAFT_658225 [Wilcoxina mikolae CBS 423.85]
MSELDNPGSKDADCSVVPGVPSAVTNDADGPPPFKHCLPVRPIGSERVEAAVKEVLGSLPREWLRKPRDGETYATSEDAVRRLQAYAFARGFSVVVGSSTSEKIRYQCVHHYKAPRNSRRLTGYTVSKEEFDQQGGKSDDGKTLRQRTGKFCGKDCRFLVNAVKRKIPETETRESHWTLSVTRLVHSHPAAANPFRYIKHQKAYPQYWSLFKDQYESEEPAPSIEEDSEEEAAEARRGYEVEWRAAGGILPGEVSQSWLKTFVPDALYGMDSIQHLFGKISSHAFDKIKAEWIKAMNMSATDWSATCACNIIQRFGLPCSHILLPYVGGTRLLPLRYVNPGWLLDEYSHGPPNWKMPAPAPMPTTRPNDHFAVSGFHLITKTVHQLHHNLRGEHAEEYAQEFEEMLEKLQEKYNTDTNTRTPRKRPAKTHPLDTDPGPPAKRTSLRNGKYKPGFWKDLADGKAS